jgi:uncharacterized membrane protein
VTLLTIVPTIAIALVCIFLAGIAVVFLRLFIRSLTAEAPRIETHWGGLGGGLGGWTISASFMYFAMALIALVLLTATATVWPGNPRQQTTTTQTTTATDKPAPADSPTGAKTDGPATSPLPATPTSPATDSSKEAVK